MFALPIPNFLRGRLRASIYRYSNPFRILEYTSLVKGARFKGKRVLDLGCGYGHQARCLAGRGASVVGVDPDESAIQTAQSVPDTRSGGGSVDFLCSTIEQAGFPEQSFDVIISFCVIEHIPDYKSVFRECFRVLKKNGRLLFTTDSLAPISGPLIEKHRKDHKVVQYFNQRQCTSDLLEAGFGGVTTRPILCSVYARKQFERGIQNGFSYTRTQALLAYLQLVLAEKLARTKTEGVFLLARAMKPYAPSSTIS